MSDVYAASRRAPIEIEGKLAFVALVYTTAAMIFSWEAYLPLLKQYAVTHFIALPGLLFFVLITGSMIVAPGAPIQFLKQSLRERWRGAVVTTVIFCFSVTAFSTFKHHIPAAVPFFADRPLADLDDLLFGNQPWRLLHQISSPAIGPPLYFLYGNVWFAQLFGTFLLALFLTDADLRRRYLVAFTISAILLGTVLRVAGASAGPIFYDRMFGGDRFADLIIALSSEIAGRKMLDAANYLHSAYLSDDAVFGSGISAMPSMHVAMAVLNALFLSSLNRWAGALGWAYAACIMFGSVYFGWHYAVDGFVSAVAMFAIWHVAGRVANTAATGS
ncbi:MULTISPECIES: phosphatase PAP2 family protein [unclassified Sinorhizobium]|uniref:phosphatase PAP2 family protein n=1 Tax=unclassified Sinorhizobium TaxID=2613772 RepID=UPI0024C26A3E|nr:MULTISPECIES: phosphatase PAP2 family protein [unclassified Sinorhizobium]MDK1375452.1 phosphatase PAP2 family protein [Sinorhizobium sp. 6-70]MDK1481836.1 phosphatase PAP2 family protein [Sinorhizobium sp. 6-117]